MNLDDAPLFLDTMGDAQPLKNHADVHWQPTHNLRTPARVGMLQLDNFLSTGFLDIVPLDVSLEFRREGLQNDMAGKLRNGKCPQQASLNLTRQPVETCRQVFFSFILQAQQERLRNVSVTYGKGRDGSSHADIVRSYATHWLTEFDDVQAYCTALPCHGGSRVYYVVSCKTAQAKQDNWGRHAKRSR